LGDTCALAKRLTLINRRCSRVFLISVDLQVYA
jgi:hypothetical protein